MLPARRRKNVEPVGLWDAFSEPLTRRKTGHTSSSDSLTESQLFAAVAAALWEADAAVLCGGADMFYMAGISARQDIPVLLITGENVPDLLSGDSRIASFVLESESILLHFSNIPVVPVTAIAFWEGVCGLYDTQSRLGIVLRRNYLRSRSMQCGSEGTVCLIGRLQLAVC